MQRLKQISAKELAFRQRFSGWMSEDTEHQNRQDGDRSRYLLQPFLSYAFVCIYLEQKRHKGNKIIKERQNKTQNEDVIHLSELVRLSLGIHPLDVQKVAC